MFGLLPIYASLGSEYDVKRVWAVCESDPNVNECMNAIDAFGELKKVDEADQAVFEKMLKKRKQLSTRHYTAMLKVYAYNKMFTKGKDLVKRMNESGCGIEPDSLDALVEFYLKAGEIEEADLILTSDKGKPLFGTYMMILGEYGLRGDVDNAEKIFERMRVDGYGHAGELMKNEFILRTDFNAKVPAYGFRNRLKADDIVPDKLKEIQLAQLDAFKNYTLSYQHD